ncbi:hypothetical protein BST96_16525 [Oceanicoccus sagamiensis]|uniref:Enoyl-CoA hydratase n=1 Tax=Oceanicoccus sagamiensis TaxID=716816 RepID=A0A1X9NBZ4_9GAMM|nr:hypothetical protein BST96_16525 [Oceanicoccus sagamiensis]
MSSRLLIEKQETVWIARFNNPPHSYMDHLTGEALTQLLDEVDGDSVVRAVIFTGSEEGVFIRHYDVAVLLERSQGMAERGLRFSLDRLIPESQLHQCLARMESMPIAFIAAINGTAMGGGLKLLWPVIFVWCNRVIMIWVCQKLISVYWAVPGVLSVCHG